jgi:hypothetical protein
MSSSDGPSSLTVTVSILKRRVPGRCVIRNATANGYVSIRVSEKVLPAVLIRKNLRRID